jgi:nicotinate-nucleotide pyrophosphorylase (carboxylating)
MQESMENLVASALLEDVGHEDITTNSVVDADLRCSARLFAKQEGVLSGIQPFRVAFEVMRAEIGQWSSLEDGAAFAKGDLIASFTGKTRAVLTAERTAMNFVQHLSGVATVTRRFVDELQGVDCRVCGTRKTTPLLRHLEKSAIVHGGGATHRHSLFDGVLIKENHVVAAGGIGEAVRRARNYVHHLMRVEVEVRDLDEFDQALASEADVIMLDNMDNETMAEAVRRARGHKVLLEASGNASLERVRAMAATGVNFVSVGALTHSAPSIDLTLLIENI